LRVGWAAILHNGVIVPGTFVEEQYNSALCNLALGSFVFYEIIKTRCFLELCNEYANGTSSKMQLPIDFKTLSLRWRAEQTKRQPFFAFATNWILVCGEFLPN
tara:strand:- start:840 stop:1148 length:309 start_codon:yes stop_codon:yes gene_type:complete